MNARARWVKEGREKGASHVISVCDTFDYEDYPVYVMPGQDVNERAKDFRGKNMQKVNEIIDLSNKWI